MTIDVPAGWRTFCRRVTCYTWKNDYDLRLWWEQARNDLILRRSQCPMCRNGRSFFWWLSDCVEPELSAFVSGVFVGGRQRLHYDHFEIKPPKEWRELLGWAPELRNPLQWGHCGVPVARYDRRHGPLRDAPHGPHCRQPVVVRWLITDEAFQEVERVCGEFVSGTSLRYTTSRNDRSEKSFHRERVGLMQLQIEKCKLQIGDATQVGVVKSSLRAASGRRSPKNGPGPGLCGRVDF